ncbi:MAG: glycoside hydrolase family 3 C-terminal domain-containing protein [Bacteroides stercoris]|jgi:hypothetical protein|nr:glycoside hydrolase family 3 C-terminal domain-containing protein [Bacteroides stercoris]
MNKFRKTMVLFSILLMASCHQQTPAPVIVSDVQVEEKVEQVLSKMTLDEKIGQMTQLSIDVLGSFVNGEFVLDESKLQQAIAEFKVGSVLNAPGPVAQTAAKWQEIIGRIQEVSMKEIGIPCIYGLDQTHGTTYTLDGILFPQNINIAASFNPELAYEAARITAYETRAGSCPWTFSPAVDMARDPRWSRIWENFGEDCLVNAIMGSQSILGYQGDEPNHIPANRIAASVKHYMGYSSARTGKDRTPAYISESELREKCFAPFKACVEAGALTIMVNSGSINGVPVHANHELLTKWLKEDLQWDGMLVTDWADINNLYTREHVAASKKEAIKMAVNAGIDMAMEPYDLGYCTLLKELVEENEVSMARIDDAVRRVLRLKVRLGLFEQPITPMADYPLLGSEEHAQLALKAAEESEILLKNKDQILPLKKGTKILVTGPNAHSMRCLNGGWSYSWQGHLADRFASKYNTLYEAICQEFGADHVRLEQGVTYVAEGTYTEENTPEIAKAVAAAHQVDVIIACIGENSYCETPGNLSEMAISENQRNLVKALATTGKPMILVLNEGRPRIIHDLEPLAQGIIHIMLPGNFGGNALANILSGEANPSAKMPYTYPRHEAELTTYDYRVSEEMDKMEGAYDYDAVISVQWPFGYGLSYTTFEYSRLVCSHSDFNVQDELTFTVDVTNTGKRTGKEVVMLFSRDMVASLTPENRRLRAFQKVELKPGETKQVTLKIPASDLAFVGSDGRWILEAGEFRIQVGNQLIHIQCSETYQWNTPNR